MARLGWQKLSAHALPPCGHFCIPGSRSENAKALSIVHSRLWFRLILPQVTLLSDHQSWFKNGGSAVHTNKAVSQLLVGCSLNPLHGYWLWFSQASPTEIVSAVHLNMDKGPAPLSLMPFGDGQQGQGPTDSMACRLERLADPQGW